MKVEHYTDGFETKIHLVLDSGYRLSTSFIDDDAGDVNTTNDSALLVIAEANAIVSQDKRIAELAAENKRLREASEWIEEYGLARIHEVFQWVYEYLYDDAMSMPQSPGGNPPCECPWCGEIFEMATDHKDDCELVQMTMEVQRINYHLAKALPEPPKEQQP